MFRFSKLFVICLFGLTPAAFADVKPHAGMLRYPDVSKDDIVFVYANDIWIVPRTGGTALPLASPPGQEQFPRFSPDGQRIAFVGNYDGNRDLYVMSINGGAAQRVTYHPDAETLCDWVPAKLIPNVSSDSSADRLLYYSNAFAGLRRQQQLMTVSVDGGLPEKLPVPYGANGAISPDGQWLAYTPHTTDFRTWKRYRGGMATDIWLFNLRDKTAKKATDWEGTDTQPMWQDKTLYYLSDAGSEHRLNIWSYDPASNKRAQVTHFEEFDIKWPSIGPGPNGRGEIIFQMGRDLRLLDLSTGKDQTVEVIIPGDRPRIRPREFDVKKHITNVSISPTGKRAVAEARGDIWTLPAQKGSARNMTRTSGIFERDPSWSPDGKWIAYFSDATGEYELYTRPADGKAESPVRAGVEPKQLTHGSPDFYYSPTWSPDSKYIAFNDKAGGIWLCNAESPARAGIEAGTARLIDTDPWAGQPRLSWSKDSRWIAYAKSGDNRQSALFLYEVEPGKVHQVTSGVFNDFLPTFDRKGDNLYFISSRNWTSPAYEDLGTTFVYNKTNVIMAIPLKKDGKAPFAPKSDEETPSTQPADATSQPASAPSSAPASQPASQPSSQPDDKKPIEILLDKFERRAVILPMKRGVFGDLVVAHDGKLIYSRGVASGDEGDSSIKIFDLSDENDKKEEQTVFGESGSFVISADGKKLLIRKDDTLAIVDAAKDQKLEKPISTDGLKTIIDPRAEWKQIFTDVWRLQRDFFYDPHMHGVDWPKMRDRYAKMLADCASREDVSYVIAELISELNAGHTYYSGGDIENPPSVTVGMLGCDYELANGAYRIKKIYEGGAWDADGRGPLSQPGIDVKEGDYLLAVNRVPIDMKKDPWAAFQGLAGKVVTLTVSEKPTLDAGGPDPSIGNKAREVIIELPDSEAPIRYRAWIENKRDYVSKKTDGKVGYIYVPNTGTDGQNDLFRQFYGQIDKQALIIDERWNGGGQIPTRFIELLNRPATNYWARRDGKDWPWPPDSHQGPKCMLINGLAGSGGDAFPAYFKMMKIGKLIGMRTWGGLIGISGNPGLIDGGATTVPTFGYYKLNSTWGIEGHGVDPDIEVVDDPSKMTNGGDPQLDAAIKLMLEEVKTHPFIAPKRPQYPNRSGMGVREEDK
jgi:tricorn protease